MSRFIMVAAGVGAVLALGACAADDEDRPGGARHAAALPQLTDVGGEANFEEPLTLGVRAAQIESAEVVSSEGDALQGEVGDDGSTWTSATRPDPGSSYEVTVTAWDRYGRTHTLTEELDVAEIPEENRLTLTMQPGNESVVGVGAPIVVRFSQPVTEREAIEREMHVSSDPQVVGSWHWVSDTEVRFRPQEYWPAGTQVALDLEFNGVRAGDELWGGRSYHLEFEIGEERIAEVDADDHTMSITVDGERQHTWNTSLGAPDFATRNGTYIVLERHEERNMTSCNANITCDPSDPDYYDVDTDWVVRLSYSGTFVHSAPWSEESQGEDNVSHGCINLSAANAETYFDMVRYGDLVVVENSTREADDLVERGDPGMVDWNQSWDRYVSGSALGEEFTTGEL